ncbi:MAG: CBS domain-containing protein [Nanoarchaeota archaeon]|nr:CBS domain-containing protein [Nanoarchaeota archaeon]
MVNSNYRNEIGIKVHDAMTHNPVDVSFDINLQECAKVMANNHVGALLIKEGEQVVGIVTEQDIVRKAVFNDLSPSKTLVKDIMETHLVKIGPKDDVVKALQLMRNLNVRHLPVFDGDKFVGLITTKDVLKIEPQLFELLAEKIELKEEARKPINTIHEQEGICESCGNYASHLYSKDGTHVCYNCRGI